MGPEDPVSLLLNNDIIDLEPESNAAMLKQIAIDDRWIQDLDWANTSDRLIVNSDGGLFIVPVPELDTQQAVADGTVLVIGEPEVWRIWPSWSPDDTALIYKRGVDGGETCSVPIRIRGKNYPRNLVIGMLDNPVVEDDPPGTDDPDKIECNDRPEDEIVLDSDGHAPEWWRGTFPEQLPLPLPSL